MKIKALAVSALSLALLASCGGSTGKSLNDKSTATDSLSYTFGEMAGMQRAMNFEQDSTLREEKAQKAYNQGFADGFKVLKGDEAYNQGFLLGLQLALQMQDLQKNNGIELNRDYVLGGFHATRTDSVDPSAFQRVQERGARMMSTILSEQVKGEVEKIAKAGNYQQKEGMYFKQSKAGQGANLAGGQTATVRINIMDKSHKELIPGIKDQDMPYQIGSGQIPVLEKALPLMNAGAVYEIVAGPQQVFGPQVPPMVNQKEPVIVTIEVVGLGAPQPEAPADSVPAAK